jgi:arginine-tRNA-protein transferase
MSKPFPPPVAIPLTTLPSHACNYLPGRVATTRAFRIHRMPGALYERFMDAGFRRSGQVIYQPVCEHCSECVPIRVPVADFKPDKSQRRCARRNADLPVTVGVPELTDEKLDLYRRYMLDWHEPSDQQRVDRDSVESFLYQSPVDTLEFCYRSPDGKLLGVGLADISRRVLSSVYFYFDPAESARGLGTFSAIYELDWARRNGIEFYYLGFWIRDCGNMNYKSRFKPAQVLLSDGNWRNLQ